MMHLRILPRVWHFSAVHFLRLFGVNNPRHAFARVTVVALCVCVCLCVCPHLFVCSHFSCFNVCLQVQPTIVTGFSTRGFSKKLPFKSYGVKKPIYNEYGSLRGIFPGPAKASNYVKDDWLVECCFRDQLLVQLAKTSEI